MRLRKKIGATTPPATLVSEPAASKTNNLRSRNINKPLEHVLNTL